MTKSQKEYALLGVAAATLVVIAVVGPFGGTTEEEPAPAAPPPVPSAAPAAPATPAAAPTQAAPPQAAPAEAPPETPPSPRLGPAEPKVTLIVALDLACDSCAYVQPMLQRVRETWPDDVAIVFKHLPAADRGAAAAALAAHRQGRFWEYHERLAPARAEADLVRHARELGLDVARFDADRRDPEAQAPIEADRLALASLGYDRPPVLLLNGLRVLQGIRDFDGLRPLVEAELKAVDETLAAGTPRSEAHRARAIFHTGPQMARYWGALVLGGPVPEAPPPATPPPALGDVFRTRGQRTFDATVWKAEVLGHEPVSGPADALVTIVEFSEFQCAFCARASTTLRELRKRHGDEVRVVWKHFLVPDHDRAPAAARATLAAHDAGRFWAMHDALFAAPEPQLTDADLVRFGAQAGLAAAVIRGALGRDDPRLHHDAALAERLNVRGAPTIFVNGRRLGGARPEGEWTALVDEELAKARAAVAGGLPRAQVYPALMATAKVFEPLGPQVHAFDLEGRPAQGSPRADVVIAAFIDFQSMNSADLVETLDALLADPEVGSRLRVVYKQLPHPLHAMAFDAAVASLAGHAQGKFRAMRDALFANQRYLMPFQLKSYAASVGLDAARYDAFVAGEQGKAMVQADAAEARAAGVTGVPAVFVNGRLLEPDAGYSASRIKLMISKHFPRK